MVFKVLSGIFFTLVVLIALFLLGTQISIPGNYQVRIVQSGSMEPTIKTGSVVVIKPAPTYATGDIITFRTDGGEQVPTTHRIVEEKGNGSFITQGDANDRPDIDTVQTGDIIGRVRLSLPYVGFVVDFARQPLGFIILIVIPAFIVIVDEIVIIFKEVGRMRKKKQNNTYEQ